MCYNPWGCRVGHDLATEHRQAKLQDIRSIQKSQLYFYILENKQPEVEILKEYMYMCVCVCVIGNTDTHTPKQWF